MSRVDFEQLLDAGCHFGHLKRKWNPAMAQYIFMEKNGIHIIDLNKTVLKLDEACAAAKQMAKSENAKKTVKKDPLKTPKEKKEKKRLKKAAKS